MSAGIAAAARLRGAPPEGFAAAALVAAVHSGDSDTKYSPLGASPWLLLRLDAFDDTPPRERHGLLRWLRRRACPVVGLGDTARDPALADACDVIVADEAGAAEIIGRVERTPLAAMTLVQVLRASARMPVDAALAVESMGYSTLQAGPEFRAWAAARPRRAPVPAAAGLPLSIERRGAVLSLALDRPGRRNALSVDMRDALVEALELAAGDATIAAVEIRGEGPDFCSGGDLDEFATAPDPATAHAVRSVRSVAAALEACRERVNVRVHGACVGAGAELAAFAGVVTATPDAWFQLPELSFGLIPGAGGCVSLPRRIGRQHTAWLALTGRRMDAPTALAWGLVDSIE